MKRSIGMLAAVGKKHVVEQHAVIGLADIRGILHGLGREADLVAFHHAAGFGLQRHPGLLHGVGIVDGHGRMLDRKLADLSAGALRFIQPLGGVANTDFIQHAAVRFLRIANDCILQASDSFDFGDHFVAHVHVRETLRRPGQNDVAGRQSHELAEIRDQRGQYRKSYRAYCLLA